MSVDPVTWRLPAILETLVAIRRAGAGQVLTYRAVEAARWLARGWREPVGRARGLLATVLDRPRGLRARRRPWT